MSENSLFSSEKLNAIFAISAQNPDRIVSRESSTLEFKESFGWNSLAKYLKTCAAYANTKGGYLVFGITNNPRITKGLSGKALKRFEDIDAETISNKMNELFSPEILWDIHIHEVSGKQFGLIYIHESNQKPVVCKTNSGDVIKEGDIYYRYRGRTERIKYSELRSILEEKRENEQKIWMRHILKIGRIGVEDAGIFDLKTGIVSGNKGSFIIDENLLSQLAFIKEGEFKEVKGKGCVLKFL